MNAPAKKKTARRAYKTTAGDRVPGVTTILGVLDKPALLGWAYRSGIKAVRRLLDGDGVTSAALDALEDAPSWQKERDAAADLGTYAHALVAHALGAEEAPEQPFAFDAGDIARAEACRDRVLAWIKDTGAEVLRVEHAMVSETWRVGGTFDLLLRLDGHEVIADLKTGKRAYDEVILQLAAYRSMLIERGEGNPSRGLVLSAPIDGDKITALHIGTDALDEGAQAFEACLLMYRARQRLTLDKVATTLGEVTT